MELRIKPTRELFFNEDNFFGIYGAEVNPEDLNGVEMNKYGNISIKGTMPRLNSNEEYVVFVKPDTKGNFKGSYIVESIKQVKPNSIADQKVFLSAILTKNQVEEIFKVYNEDQNVIELIEKNEFDYNEVKGLGEKSFKKLQKKVMDNLDLSEILSFCSKYEIKYSMIAGLVKKYKNPTIVIEKINSNPYTLTEVKGVGFHKADEVAKAVKYDMESPFRILSALHYIIGVENASGHSWIKRRQLINKAIELLGVEKELIERSINDPTNSIIDVGDDRITTEKVKECERYIAERMTNFKTSSKKVFESSEIDSFLDEYCQENNVELEENQRQFFHDWNENSILFLVGGGGMGKSWLQNILLKLIKRKNYTVSLLAPTGRASKVMTGYTGITASTIHRRTGSFSDEDAGYSLPIEEDVVIVDESSMCDIFILNKFFNSLTNTNTRVLFVGDDFQLPSVGVGNFLYDCIHSLCVKISVLTKVFRQKSDGILDVATKIRNGQVFLEDNSEGRSQFGNDCVFWLVEQDFIRDGILTNYKKSIKKFEQDEIIILSPTNKGKLGTVSLNKQIQKIANPQSESKKEHSFGKEDPIVFRVGDRVMNVVNTYGAVTFEGGSADIFNGDTGTITDIDEIKKEFIINFDNILVRVKFSNMLTNIVHAWAVTIHKSQGSQYKVVILVVDKSMTYQLNANLLYTGVSRATQYLLVLGQAKALNTAIRKFANMERRSLLQELLNNYNGFEGSLIEDNSAGKTDDNESLLEDSVEDDADSIEKIYM